jgi:CubicO group peptidase (beta-lactamase class C family)
MVNRKPKSMIAWMLVVVTLATAACQPVQPVERAAGSAVEPTPVAVEEAPARPPSLAGRYAGSLAVAGMELEIIVELAEGEAGYTGAIDIPAQGAAGIPLHDIRIEPPTVYFEMLAGPALATFDGALDEAGAISGAFSQAGITGEFSLAPADAPTATDATTMPPGVSDIYTDPAGRFSAPIPTNWAVRAGEGYVLFTDPEEAIKMVVVVIENDDLGAATAEAWRIFDPAFDLAIDETIEPPSSSGFEQTLVTNYDADDRNRIVQAVAQLKDGVAYVILVDGSLAAFQRRNAQVAIIGSGFKMLGDDETDLSQVTPLPVTDDVIAALEEFIATYLEAFGVPGAVVGIIEGNELIYKQGFGVADLTTGAPMTPDKHMMIGSTGKSLTTMLMGALVDDGLMTWDTPAQQLHPGFRVKDPTLSETITMRNLVCACTGVPRRDLELLFNADSLAAQNIVASLADFEFFTDFGEAFQYSNQMVGAAGYIAGEIAEPDASDMMTAYEEALQSRVLDPIGMTNTTLSFDAVIERDNYATPHAQTLEATYTPLALDVEALLLPIAPAGAHWSTLEDMARYMITQLQEGVAPDGERVVSSENLKETWKPQIAISNDASYGLGWIVSSYNGQPVISHAGNTFGFTSGFTFLPERELGVIVLTNGRATNLFNDGVASRLLELIYEQPAETQRNLDFYLEQIDKQVQELAAQISDELDGNAVESHLGRFANPALGDIVLMLDDDRLLLDAGEFVTELRPKFDSKGELEGYIQLDPPLQGLVYRFDKADDGEPIVVLGEGAVEYTFVQGE